MLNKEQVDELVTELRFQKPDTIRGHYTHKAADAIVEQQAEIERLREIIEIMDSVTPKADHTCDEPGIALSVAVQRRYPHLNTDQDQ